ncbi:chromosome partitioning protein [Parabacteroides sp. PF5-5]|uniref:ParA family protein n=1 Tax=unclassified Parabacteroides TaxID=2649774 RepID=UPI00247538ED|nr:MULTISPECIES: AAA family ATPase [unclassified Parabacteroides]MDH6306722.1 chromosome partitioning protein [Parabacteroides sp. PH5-39]MDH6316213.1 chromosome partitioning protein [Parabacteroides sp. PF5-13]MDH6321426.1 chromosome partitioning protein [Parabacteroides sp. PH5-13]MDH6325157.1 chromosome partitioning protein [Parabacteroides sp. PH5-8]MDH6327404.1 chromosome partitioning protein [Parabacteroides sp. PH5-41]
MNNSENQKQTRPVYISFCTQKGGAGKSVFTTLVASYLHYQKEYNVAVIDCDFPQWSIQKMRKREAEQLQSNAFYQKKAEALFAKLGKPTYPIVPTKPEQALARAKAFLENEAEKYDVVLFDLPGTVNNENVVEIFFQMDYLFVPVTTSRINMESTLPFIISINEMITMNPQIRLKGIYPFWNKVTNRERKELFNYYEEAILGLGISIMESRIPQSVRYDREQSIEGNDYLFLSTIFPPDKPLLKDSKLDLLVEEIVKIINL